MRRSILLTGACIGLAAACGGSNLPDSSSSSCVASPSITGHLDPAWSLALGEGAAGGMKLDAHGNVIVVGSFYDRLRVGEQTFSGPADSSNHAFALALDPGGRILWERTFPDNWTPADFALDGADNLYLVGTQGQYVPTSADLGNGPVAGAALLAKLDSHGNTIWSHGLEAFLDASIYQVVSPSLAVEPSGQLAIVGAGFAPTTAVSFLARYDASGAFLWSMSPGSDAMPRGVAIDPAGNAVVTGWFQGTLDWGGSPMSAASSAFVTKIDPAKNVLWNLALGELTTASAVAVDGPRTFVSGSFGGSLTLGGQTVATQGLGDIFVAAIDDGAPAATSLFARFPASFLDQMTVLTPDGLGGVVAMGGIGDFVDMGAGLMAPPAVVLAHLDGGGQTVASAAFSAPGGSSARAVAMDSAGNTYAFGTFSGATDLGDGVLTESGIFGSSLFVAKYARAPASVAVRRCAPPAGALLGSGQQIYPSLLALAGDQLALSTGTETMIVPLGGGAPTMLATAQKHTIALAAHGDSIYWANAGTSASSGAGLGNDGSIVSIPIAGGAPTVLAAGQDGPVAMAVDDANVYWITGGERDNGTSVTLTGTLWAIPLGGGSPTSLATGFRSIGPVAAGDGMVVFATGDAQSSQLMMTSPSGGDAMLVASTDRAVAAIALDGATIYWLDANSQTVDVSANNGRLRSVRLALGATANVLLDGLPGPTDLFAIAGQLYWADRGGFNNAASENLGGVWQMSATGGGAAAIVSGLPAAGPFAADEAHLVWLENDASESWKVVVRPR